VIPTLKTVLPVHVSTKTSIQLYTQAIEVVCGMFASSWSIETHKNPIKYGKILNQKLQLTTGQSFRRGISSHYSDYSHESDEDTTSQSNLGSQEMVSSI